MKLRARDKLAETEFFLDELKRHKEELPKFRYCLSAFVTALRSVTFVLQADLRARFKDAFETWWASEANTLRTLPHARALVQMRNVSQKEGNRLPELRLEFNDPERAGCCLTAQVDLSRGALTRVDQEFGDALSLVPADAVVGSASDDVAIALEVYKRSSEQIVSLTKRLLGEVKPSRSIVIDDGGSVMPIDDFIAILEQHLDARRQIVEKAEKHFVMPADAS